MNRRPISVPILRVFLTLNAAIASAFSVQAAPGLVYESDAEFQTLADVDGDGFADLIVVDKATGQFRVATGSVNGSLTWRVHSGNSGLPGVTGFSAGPLLNPRYDSLLF